MRSGAAHKFVALCLVLCGLAGGEGKAQILTADLSSHIIGITTGFVGAQLVLFGSSDRPGDIVAVVRGMPSDIAVRRKEKTVGMWINGRSVIFHGVPSFYAIAANRPLESIATQEVLRRYSIGISSLTLSPVEPSDGEDPVQFRNALIDQQERSGLYRRQPSSIVNMGSHLFRADLDFPANVPTGPYVVEVFLFVDGELVGAQTTPLIVSRIGFSNGVYVAAHRHAIFYGLSALAIAVAAGWIGGVTFRRV